MLIVVNINWEVYKETEVSALINSQRELEVERVGRAILELSLHTTRQKN